MNKLVILFAVVAVACARKLPYSGDEKSAEVLRQVSDVHPEGYSFSYETSNGVSAQEQGHLQGEAIVAQGSFRYTADDGTPVEISYVADENGFQPSGAHLPVAPPTPDHVLKALEYIRTHTPREHLPGKTRF